MNSVTLNEKTSPSHLAIAGRLRLLQSAVDDLQADANARLASVSWDFSRLRDHLGRMAELVESGLALKAHNEHQDFSVSSPGKLMVKMRGKAPEHLVRRRGYLGGKATSEAKTIATRINLELARKHRWSKYGVRFPEREAVREEMRKIRLILRRLLYRESCSARDRDVSANKRRPRRDKGRREKRIAMLREQLSVLESKWASISGGYRPRVQRSAPSEDWLIPPESTTQGDPRQQG